MLLKWLKRFLLWIIGIVLIALSLRICRGIFGLFFNDTLSMILSAAVVGIVAALREQEVDIEDTESSPATQPPAKARLFRLLVVGCCLLTSMACQDAEPLVAPNELRPAPYFPTVPDYRHEFI